uniref:Uncharacterized protein n=1 Tax=Oryza rufipogon TaxID=4529 RepID=A0A0E0N0I8_ORYRU
MAAGEQERQGGGVQRGGVHLSPLYLYFLRVFTDEEAAARDGLWKRSGARRLAGEEQRAAANLPVSSSSAAAVWIPPLSCRICTAAAMVLSPPGMARRVGTRKGGRSSGATTVAGHERSGSGGRGRGRRRVVRGRRRDHGGRSRWWSPRRSPAASSSSAAARVRRGAGVTAAAARAELDRRVNDDLEELKGCVDLGFGFNYDVIPELCSTAPCSSSATP